MSISEEQIEALARLAQLELDPEEIPAMTRDLAAILAFAARLDALAPGAALSAGELERERAAGRHADLAYLLEGADQDAGTDSG